MTNKQERNWSMKERDIESVEKVEETGFAKGRRKVDHAALVRGNVILGQGRIDARREMDEQGGLRGEGYGWIWILVLIVL
ncbi:hypothetical protein K0M31_018389 [Melipona bicolor]|uniref:Uncharacterized protein n=1 Tax=Melipona bicolor TaxID=60889 RepID=A0AA40G3C7_9HYME|nr:hypothetical protein K0M31_018389 [Melipona bicolor]